MARIVNRVPLLRIRRPRYANGGLVTAPGRDDDRIASQIGDCTCIPSHVVRRHGQHALLAIINAQEDQ